MPTAPQIDAPLSLGSLFPDSSDDEDGERQEEEFDQCYETQSVNLCNVDLKVRQYAFHSHNANRVWPGTFNLCEYLLGQQPPQNTTTTIDDTNDGNSKQRSKDVASSTPEMSSSNPDSTASSSEALFLGDVLELGTATGLLSIRLAMEQDSVCSSIVTSDVQDEGDVEENVLYNFGINGFTNLSNNNEDCGNGNNNRSNDNNENQHEEEDGEIRTRRTTREIPIHVPHTWGTGWDESAEQKGIARGTRFDTIIASDILLYVSAYPALVQTLQELFDVVDQHDVDGDIDEGKTKKKNPKFIMSWNRRMKESDEFFQRMKDAGFVYQHEGKCVYTFEKQKIE